jgi:plastocyanin
MTVHRRWLRLIGVAFALVLVLGACSGDDDDGGDDASASGSTESDDGGGDAEDEAACDGDICLSGIQFAPDAVTVAVGDTVTWASIDSPDHTVTADDGAFDSGTLSNGDVFETTFDEAGDFAFHCEIHPSMTGTVTVE